MRYLKHSSEILVHIMQLLHVYDANLLFKHAKYAQLRSGDCGSHLSEVNSLSC